MAPGPYERVLETLEDLDARLAGLEVRYSEPNATAARELVADLADFFENDPQDLVALQEAVETMVEAEDSSYAATAKEHADALQRQILAQIDDD